MTAESTESTHRRVASRLARCLRLVAGIVVLLAISETIWLWQTWPVRQLVQPPQPALPLAAGR